MMSLLIWMHIVMDILKVRKSSAQKTTVSRKVAKARVTSAIVQLSVEELTHSSNLH